MTTKNEIIRQNAAFIYGRNKEDEKHDPDKRSFIKSAKKFVDETEVNSFEKEFEFLSPSFPCTVCFGEDFENPYPSYEHAFISSKIETSDPLSSEVLQQVRELKNIRDAKRYITKMISANPALESVTWKNDCFKLGERLMRDKFMRNKELRSKLVDTKGRTLTYRNDHNDMVWGVCFKDNTSIPGSGGDKWTGQNRLGKLMEQIRNEILSGDDLHKWIASHFDLIERAKIGILVTIGKRSDDGSASVDDMKSIDNINVLYIGKADDSDVVALHPSVSRTHAIVVADKTKRLFIVDLQSSNGTSVDGVKLRGFTPTLLRETSSVVIGASTREYKFTPNFEFDKKAQSELISSLTNPHVIESQLAQDMQELTVFVGNIAFAATEAEVKDFFSRCGEIVRFNLVVDTSTMSHKGIAFITFASLSSVMQALSLDGDILVGRPVKVKRNDKRSADNSSSRQNSSSSSSRPSKNAKSSYADNDSVYSRQPTKDLTGTVYGGGGKDLKSSKDRHRGSDDDDEDNHAKRRHRSTRVASDASRSRSRSSSQKRRRRDASGSRHRKRKHRSRS